MSVSCFNVVDMENNVTDMVTLPTDAIEEARKNKCNIDIIMNIIYNIARTPIS